MRNAIYGAMCAAVLVVSIVEVPILINTSTNEESSQCKYAVVLGAGLWGDRISLSLSERLNACLDFLNSNENAIAIVSGGQGEGEYISEAQAMNDWLIEHGIDQDRIIMEDRSTSTKQNIEFSVEIIKKHNDDVLPDSIAIVSSDYHLFRAKSYLKEYSVEAYGVSAKTSYPILRFNYLIREAFAVMYMWVFE